MKDKFVKAYRVAWQWPELYSNSLIIIWLSRAIVFLLPAGLVALTLITGAPLYGTVVALILSALMGLSMAYATVRMFYKEYDTVEESTTRDTLINEFFHGFPSYTSVPLIEYEPHVWVAYTHVGHAEMRSAVMAVILAAGAPSPVEEGYPNYESVQTYARFVNPEDGHWSEGIEICKPSAHGAFPITRLEYTKI